MGAEESTTATLEPKVDESGLPGVLGILPLRNVVLFPGMVAPLVVGREKSLKLIEEAAVGNKQVGLVTQRNSETDDPTADDLYSFGVAARIMRMLRLPNNNVSILVQGLGRFKIEEYFPDQKYLLAKVSPVDEEIEQGKEIEALSNSAVSQFQKLVSMTTQIPDEVMIALMNLQHPGQVADFIVSNLSISVPEKEQILETLNVKERLQKVNYFLGRELQMREMETKIQQQVQTELGKAQKEIFLRQQMKAIQDELGEGDERTVEIKELKKKIEEANMLQLAREASERELDRLTKMPPGAAEYSVSRTYLDWLIALPWSVSTEDNLDIKAAGKILERDHYDLEKIKERILEFLAVRKLKKDMKGPIFCFVGPPGVGKTSLGKSIASSLGRKFVRISLGGIRDEAEIRGHRRTYVGALPGRIIQGIRKAGASNPVFMLDEVDKVGTDFRGDPSSALLEVLDPEQNNSFSDHYVEVPFDLSKVMFICTANIVDPIPDALRDRMEMLELPGYIEEEKLKIAQKYLIPRQLSEHGLSSSNLKFEPKAVLAIIRDYTREAGLRNLEREIATICRKVAKKTAEGEKKKRKITPESLSKYLGPAKFFQEVAERTSEAGVATGLAWTARGGEILFVEATRMPGGKGLMLTGQLGDVMKESAQAALSIIRGKAQQLRIDPKFFDHSDIHLHVPAGGIPKDGPSAGVTMVAALSSLLTGKPVRSDTAMTGEVTLRGRVLPVGGVKEKILAAHRAGIKTVIMPEKNKKDLEEIPERVKKDIAFKFVTSVDQVLKLALEDRKEKGKVQKKQVNNKTGH